MRAWLLGGSDRQPVPLFFAAVIFGLVASAGKELRAEPTGELRMTVALAREDNGRLLLRFQVTNRTSKRLSLQKPYLPWGSRESLLVVVTENGPSGETLEQLTYFDDQRTEPVPLATGESLQGVVRLTRRFTDLDAAIQSRALILFWAYRPQWGL